MGTCHRQALKLSMAVLVKSMLKGPEEDAVPIFLILKPIVTGCPLTAGSGVIQSESAARSVGAPGTASGMVEPAPKVLESVLLFSFDSVTSFGASAQRPMENCDPVYDEMPLLPCVHSPSDLSVEV